MKAIHDGEQPISDEIDRSSSYPDIIRSILIKSGLTAMELAQYLGSSYVSVARWARGDTHPSSDMGNKLLRALDQVSSGQLLDFKNEAQGHVFASRGARKKNLPLPLFDENINVVFRQDPSEPILERLHVDGFWSQNANALESMLDEHAEPAETRKKPAASAISAGKNTYTYDAHTYHTKVPPQGIAEVLKQYLPAGGIVLDPFAGSGMTGVAARCLGYDVVLNELSPAACFIADRFNRVIDINVFRAGVKAVLGRLASIRKSLYSTKCRECRRDTEILYTVWSYNLHCSQCDHEFLLWNHCRKYGRTVREHKILKEFPCPRCGEIINKSHLRRTTTAPVLLGYKCCSSTQIEHPLEKNDIRCIQEAAENDEYDDLFVPSDDFPDGVNLNQPKRHGLTSVSSFYTNRNLRAMAHLWREINCIEDTELAAFLAFAFTSLYQRVTKLSEFRFWGGSGNTANYNVPQIFNEANVFVTFERKAKTILDHLSTTAQVYSGNAVTKTGSATDMPYLPDNSIDLIFTDPPFGANINYSEMNRLWESWLEQFTDATDEAIVNKFQGKDVGRYGDLMRSSLQECYRVLRPGHWLILVFMNSSEKVWSALRDAILGSGFSIERVDIFDKQHGTFKHYVSENTAGSDLLLHCRKIANGDELLTNSEFSDPEGLVQEFIASKNGRIPTMPYLHVKRDDEIDYRLLYSEFLSEQFLRKGKFVDFSEFRSLAELIVANNEVAKS